jgi:hypothetical protein
MPHRSWRVTLTDSVKVIRLRSRRQTLMTLQIWENLKGPKIHVGFVFFCELSLSKDLIEQLFCLLLSTSANRQRTSRTKGMQWIILLSAKEIQRTIQQNYPYQEKGQQSWLNLLNDSICADTLLQHLSNDCLYKELKTWRRLTRLYYFTVSLLCQV